MYGLEAEVRQCEFFALGERGEHVRVEVPGGVERRPSRPDDMAGMDDGRRKRILARRLDQIRLDLRLRDAVLTERAARLHFCGGNFYAGAVHPDRSRMQEVPHLPAQGLDQMSRARFGEANHVDDDVGPEL